MTDEEKISLLALMLGDVEGGPYYPMFTEDQYRQFLKLGGGNVNKAVVYAAISASFMVSGESSREQIGELSISSSTSSNYLKLLDYIVNTTGRVIPDGLMPWFAGQDNLCNRNKLLEFSRCDKLPPWLEKFGAEPCEGGC